MKRFSVGIILISSFVMSGCFGIGGDSGSNSDRVKSEDEILYEKLEQRTNKKPLKLGVITDVHAYGKEVDGEWEINWRSKDAMLRFVDKMNNEFKPVAVVEIGDLVDGKDHNSLEDWKIMDGMMKELKMPYFNTAGNHEMRGFEKSVWMEVSGNQKTYYYKDIKGYRLIILDGNHFRDGQDTTPEREHYPGNLGSEQWQWLESTLKEAAMEDKDPIVFLHQPPVSTDLRPNWSAFPEGEALQQLFSNYKVRAVFSGHVERLCNMIQGDVEYFVLQGMWKDNQRLKREYRFKDSGSFYYVNITPSEISVKMEYRVFDDSSKKRDSERISGWEQLVLTPEQFNCQDGLHLVDVDKDASKLLEE